VSDFSIVSVNGGDKSNAIPNCCEALLVAYDGEYFKTIADEYLEIVKAELSDREENFCYEVCLEGKDECEVLSHKTSDKLINVLVTVPNGVLDMSVSVEKLVETSLNLGILETGTDSVNLRLSLRSNKASALKALEEKIVTFLKIQDIDSTVFGKYLPWEYNENSVLREVYKKIYKEQIGEEPKVEAIHAGLECGVFAAAIEDFDCISIGPFLYDVHTVNERLSISSTETVYKILLKLLEELR
jgi:dipeptidase D